MRDTIVIKVYTLAFWLVVQTDEAFADPMTALVASSMPWQPSPGSLDGIFQLDDLQALKDLQARALAQGQNQQIKQLATIQSTAEKRVSAD